ncbi:hypothetical protein AB1Y20_017426 [Prymnesium parvum]|uniref:Endonuclease/exonuclease/phosphatase domain-containing protein n=1 Tax=Prymnesium parvum TaxID=97485 RepID=A0AB34JL87_PRYPA
MGLAPRGRARASCPSLFCLLSCILLCVLASRLREWHSVRRELPGLRVPSPAPALESPPPNASCASRLASTAPPPPACGAQPLLSVAFASADGLPPRAALLASLRNADGDVTGVAAIGGAVAAEGWLPTHAAHVRGRLGVWWRAGAFELDAAGGGEEWLWVRLRGREACSCEWPAALLVLLAAEEGMEPMLAWLASAAETSVLVMSAVPETATPHHWRRAYAAHGLVDVGDALGTIAEDTTVNTALARGAAGAVPPRQAASIATSANSPLRAVSLTVLRAFHDGEAPAATWPLVATLAPRPARSAESCAEGTRGRGEAKEGRRAVRFSSMTLNAWGSNQLEGRRDELVALLRHHAPDVLCLQEVRDLHPLLLGALPEHDSTACTAESRGEPHPGLPPAMVAEDTALMWRRSAFERVNGGTVPIVGERSVLWVRLKPKTTASEGSVLLATTHLLHADTPDETSSGHGLRHQQIQAVLQVLNSIALAGEATLLMGDMNEPFHPRWRMRADGLVDCFTALGITPTPTYPAHPLAEWDLMYPSVPLDFVMSRGAVLARSCQVLRKPRPASDHWPVLATWELLHADDPRVSSRHPTASRRLYNPFAVVATPSPYKRCNTSWFRVWNAPPRVKSPTAAPSKGKNYDAAPMLSLFTHEFTQTRIAGERRIPRGLTRSNACWSGPLTPSPYRGAAGSDFGCAEFSLDLAGHGKEYNLTAAQLREASGVCRVCASNAAAACVALAPQCVSFELNGDRSLATLKTSGCAAKVRIGTMVLSKASLEYCDQPPRRPPDGGAAAGASAAAASVPLCSRPDGGPWPCREPGCPSSSVGCPLLAKRYCKHTFGAVFLSPPDGVANSTRVSFLCPHACGLCSGTPLVAGSGEAASHAAPPPPMRSTGATVARMTALCARLAPAVAVRPAPAGVRSLAAEIVVRLSPWRWGGSPALLTFNPDGIDGALETPWGEGRWGPMPNKPAVLWATFSSRTHMLRVHGALLESFRCGDNDTVRVYASQPTLRSLPGSVCEPSKPTPNPNGECTRAGSRSPWAWGPRGDRSFISFHRRSAYISCPAFRRSDAGGLTQSGASCRYRLRWSCTSATPHKGDESIMLASEWIFGMQDVRVGSLIRGDEQILLRCPEGANGSASLTSDIDGAALAPLGGFVLAYHVNPLTSSGRDLELWRLGRTRKS